MRYIYINKKNNIVTGSTNYKPSKISDMEFVVEAEGLPIRTINQYLVAENITTNTRIIREAYTQKESFYNEEKGIDEVKVVEYPAITETYLTCDFRKVDLPKKELTEAEKHEKYKAEVKRLIRLKYDLETELGIVNDYMSNDTNPEYVQKYQDYQDYRFECKAKAHKEVYGN